MRLVHDPPDGNRRTLATEVEVADTLLGQARGLMFRRTVPDDYALAFRFDDVRQRGFHTAFVRVPIDVLWTVDGVVQRVERLPAWRGRASASGETVFELAAGEAEGVRRGDRVYLTDSAP